MTAPWPTDRRVRLAVAMMGGAVEHHAQRHASTAEQCLTRLAAIVDEQRLDGDQAAEALAHTAAGYLPDGCWFRDAALAVLTEAGANLEASRRIAEARAGTTRIRFGDAEL